MRNASVSTRGDAGAGSGVSPRGDGLLRMYHKGLLDQELAHRRTVALAARRLDRGGMGYDAGLGAAASQVYWSQVECVVESDVSVLRSQLAALPIWDPDLHSRLRRWIAADGMQGLVPTKPWRLPADARHQPPRRETLQIDGLETSGPVEGDGLLMLLGPSSSRRGSAAYVWVYRFSDPATAAAQLASHPALGAASPDLRASVLCRRQHVRLGDDAFIDDDEAEMSGPFQVFLAVTWSGNPAAPPSGPGLPQAALASTGAEQRLRQAALELLVSQRCCNTALVSKLRQELHELAACQQAKVPPYQAPDQAEAMPHFTCRLADLAADDEDENQEPRKVSSGPEAASQKQPRRRSGSPKSASPRRMNTPQDQQASPRQLQLQEQVLEKPAPGRRTSSPKVGSPRRTHSPQNQQRSPRQLQYQQQRVQEKPVPERSASEEAMLEADVAAALVAAQRLLARHEDILAGDAGLHPGPAAESHAGPAAAGICTDSARMQRWIAQMTDGIEVEALAHSGDRVPVQLRLTPDLGTMHVTVPGESRDLRLREVESVSIGQEALIALTGRLPNQPPEHVCALKLRDGNCLAILLPDSQARDLFAASLKRLCALTDSGHFSRRSNGRRNPGSPRRSGASSRIQSCGCSRAGGNLPASHPARVDGRGSSGRVARRSSGGPTPKSETTGCSSPNSSGHLQSLLGSGPSSPRAARGDEGALQSPRSPRSSQATVVATPSFAGSMSASGLYAPADPALPLLQAPTLRPAIRSPAPPRSPREVPKKDLRFLDASVKAGELHITMSPTFNAGDRHVNLQGFPANSGPPTPPQPAPPWAAQQAAQVSPGHLANAGPATPPQPAPPWAAQQAAQASQRHLANAGPATPPQPAPRWAVLQVPQAPQGLPANAGPATPPQPAPRVSRQVMQATQALQPPQVVVVQRQASYCTAPSAVGAKVVVMQHVAQAFHQVPQEPTAFQQGQLHHIPLQSHPTQQRQATPSFNPQQQLGGLVPPAWIRH
eukprot:TRINITY_DN12553_c0_g1_i1.p1 TRINITY_DN12553_c0_g1~~TRINITY_DN12553_c0_g1_i1.p1  ORF type:complete len:1001 (+),score=165.50 TRINITY_DN12553_c0_g1_i1:55-3057(+)